MVLPEIRLLQSAVVLAEELHFSRAADRLNVTQSALSKQILKLERAIGFSIFVHSHQGVGLTDPGSIFVSGAREVIVHAERLILKARAALDWPIDVLNIGKSSYTDPFLVSVLQSIRLPLYPDLKIRLWSNFSCELARQVIAGTLDLAVTTGVPDKPLLSSLTLTSVPYFIVMQIDDVLAGHRELRLEQMHNRVWLLAGRHVNPYLYDSIQSVASDRVVYPSDLHEFTSPEEASELVRDHRGLAFLPCAAAWRIACDGITIRPLIEDRLRLVSRLAMRADSKSKLVTDFVKAVGRRLGNIGNGNQMKLPLPERNVLRF